MIFSSFEFLFFFAVVFFFFWQLPKKYQWLILLIASYYFYFSWNPGYVVLILFTTTLTYAAALLMNVYPQFKKYSLGLALSLNVGILLVFKYLNFFNESLMSLSSFIDLSLKLPTFKLLLPIGISFYTFQTIGYLIDVYRGKIKAETHFGRFALFVSFFPQLVAGPIARGEQLLPQISQPKTFHYQRTVSGLKLFALGLFKKIVIADNLAVIVDTVFGSLTEFKGLSLLLTMVLFSWQIYCDFSGYTDMARGIARILGFELLENFNHPYLATSVRDFWRRWHISLSTWFRDYLYFPLGGSRHGFWRTQLNNIIVFFVCGLWHGAAWNFILWGLAHGLLITGERAVSHVWPKKWRPPQLFSLLYTYIVITASWVLFRAATLQDALYIFRYSLVGITHFFSPTYIWATANQLFNTNQVEMLFITFCILVGVLYELISSKFPVEQYLTKQPLLVRWSVYTIVVTLIILLRNVKIATFIYTQF